MARKYWILLSDIKVRQKFAWQVIDVENKESVNVLWVEITTPSKTLFVKEKSYYVLETFGVLKIKNQVGYIG